VFLAFGQVSGLKANALKSSLYMAGVGKEDKVEMMRIAGFPYGSMLFCYLGVPIATKRLKIVYFSDLLEAVKNSIGAWNQRMLSYTSKL
jgi:hypothetical protein